MCVRACICDCGVCVCIQQFVYICVCMCACLYMCVHALRADVCMHHYVCMCVCVRACVRVHACENWEIKSCILTFVVGLAVEYPASRTHPHSQSGSLHTLNPDRKVLTCTFPNPCTAGNVEAVEFRWLSVGMHE